MQRSPFCRRFHHGLADAPLADLQVLTKAAIMDNVDDLFTDRSLHLADLQAYLDGLRGNKPFAGRYLVPATPAAPADALRVLAWVP